jgi:hypothetical protein
MVRELVTGEVDRVYTSTIRGRPDRWNAELWVVFRGSSREGKILPLKERIVLGINSLLGWTPSIDTL